MRRISMGVSTSFEQHVHDAVLAAVQSGDVVWDIGANIGQYTQIFLDKVGPTGAVVAIEPAPVNVEGIGQHDPRDGRLTIVQAAISDAVGAGQISIADGATPDTFHLGARPGDASTQPVRLVTGDSLLSEPGVRPPTVFKLDVEGFEVHALRGMTQLLRRPELRQLFIEVHFSQLEANGITDGPKQIASILEPAGFKIDWLDFSHVTARRL